MGFFESLLSAAAPDAAKALADFILDIPKAGISKGWTLEKAQRAASQYQERFAKIHGQIKPLGMSEPVPVKDIYTAVQVTENIASFASREELEKAMRLQGLRNLPVGHIKTRAGIDVANDEQFLNVLGGPGAGKTTFLQRLGLEALLHTPTGVLSLFSNRDRLYKHRCLPVFLELKTLKFKDCDLVQLLEDELIVCGFPPGFAESALKKGRLLVLLDGLDEIPLEKLDKYVWQLHSSINRYDSNRFVVSCRTAFYKSYLVRFTDVVIADFDDTQVRSFITNWFRSTEERQANTAGRFWEMLEKPENRGARELARTPLLLTFLCLVHQDRHNLPSTRSNLYKYALEILLERWAAHKRVHQDPIYLDHTKESALKTDLEILLLSHIAEEAFQKDQLFFTNDELVIQIKSFLKDMLNAPKSLDGRQILKDIELRQGLFVERAHGVYSFSHLTLQEYLAAVYHSKPKRLRGVIESELFNVRWHEVFQLLAGLESVDAAELLENMADKAYTRINANAKSKRILQWALNAVPDQDIWGDRILKCIVNLSVARTIASAGGYTPDAQLLYGDHLGKSFSQGYDDLPKHSSEVADAWLTEMNQRRGTVFDNTTERQDPHRKKIQSEKDARSLTLTLVKAFSAAENATAEKIAEKIRLLQRSLVKVLDLNLDRSFAVHYGEQFATVVTDATDIAIRLAQLRTQSYLGLNFGFVPGIAVERFTRITETLNTLKVVQFDFDHMQSELKKLHNSSPSHQASTQEKIASAKETYCVFLELLGLDKDLTALTPAESKPIADFIYAVFLIFRCRDCALDLSNDAWNRITHRLFSR